MENQKANDPPVNQQSLQSAKEKLRKLKEEIDLDKPGRVEAQLDAIASDLLKSGLPEPLPGAPSLKEVLLSIKTKRALPGEAIDDAVNAAEQLGYLIEAQWYGEDAPAKEQQAAKEFAGTLCDKLTTLLNAYDHG
jgi:hypothetical protein